MRKKLSSLCYKIIKGLVRLFYPRIAVEGLENLPEEGCVIAANHCQMHGPIASELYFPGESYTWCAGEMTVLKDVPAYAYKDFWSEKPGYIRWFFKLLSYIIAPLSVCVFNNADVIPLFRDIRLRHTLRETTDKLKEGAKIVIFPEHDVKHNHIIYDFQDGFIDLARHYRKQTGNELQFVPMYIAPSLKKMYIGKAISFDSTAPAKEQRSQVLNELMDAITQMACALPEHTVIPYKNLSRKYYGTNIPEDRKAQ